MTTGVVVVTLLAALAVAFVIAPLLRRDAAEAELARDAMSEERELQSRQDMLLAALKDLEDDRAEDKIDETDYAEAQASLSSKAVEVMKRLETVAEQRRREAARPPGPVGIARPDEPESGR